MKFLAYKDGQMIENSDDEEDEKQDKNDNNAGKYSIWNGAFIVWPKLLEY